MIRHECDARRLILTRAIESYERWRDDLHDEAAEMALAGMPRRSFYLNWTAETMIPQYVMEMRESEQREHREKLQALASTGRLTLTQARR